MQRRSEMGRFTAFLIAAGAAGSLVACVARHSRPRVPERIVPDVPVPPAAPAPGQGRTIVDVVSGPAQVFEVVGDFPGPVPGEPLEGALLRPLCTTPCAIDLRLGLHLLAFARPDERDRRRLDSGFVSFERRTSVYRRSLRERRSADLALAIPGFTLAGVGVGGVFLAFIQGTLANVFGDEDQTRTALRVGGVSTVAIVTGMVIGSLAFGDPIPASEVQWQLEAPRVRSLRARRP